MEHAKRKDDPPAVRTLGATSNLLDALSLHWLEYVMEGAELALFMLAASGFGTLLFYADSPVVREFPDAMLRLVLMGFAMGTTAITIILSPMGRRSGAHFNPAVSITFLLLGRMHRLDTLFYVIAQFLGGALGVLAAHILIGYPLASPSVRYVVTIPGRFGFIAAFSAECFMGWLLMAVVLFSSNNMRLARYSWLLVGSLISLYVIAFSSISGFSVNPARTVSSALFANVWTALWIYLSAPVLGMLAAAAMFVLSAGSDAVLCAKIYHDLHSPCPFRCRFRQAVRGHSKALKA